MNVNIKKIVCCAFNHTCVINNVTLFLYEPNTSVKVVRSFDYLGIIFCQIIVYYEYTISLEARI